MEAGEVPDGVLRLVEGVAGHEAVGQPLDLGRVLVQPLLQRRRTHHHQRLLLGLGLGFDRGRFGLLRIPSQRSDELLANGENAKQAQVVVGVHVRDEHHLQLGHHAQGALRAESSGQLPEAALARVHQQPPERRHRHVDRRHCTAHTPHTPHTHRERL